MRRRPTSRLQGVPKAHDISSASIPDTLARLQVDAETGLTVVEVDTRRKQYGADEVAVRKTHPVRGFLSKILGAVGVDAGAGYGLSAVLGKYSDLAVVSALLVVNAVLGLVQERRAAGVVETFRQRLRVSARVRRDFDVADHSR